MKLWHLFGLLPALALAMLLAGCGGGGGASSATALGSISGVVAGDSAQAFTADSRTIGPATISLEGTNLSTQALPGERFTLSNVPPGLHTLVVRTATRATAVVVGVQGNRETNVGDMVLREAGSIAGTVTAADGSLLPGAHVVVTEQVLTDTADAMPHPVRATRTDANGFYALSGVPVGAYLATVAKPGYETVTLTLTVAAGATTTGDAALHALPPAESGAMKGLATLTMEDGTQRPLGGVLVRLAPQNALNPERPAPETACDVDGNTVPLYGGPPTELPRDYYTFTADDGTYLLDGIPAGDYLAVAVRPGLDSDRTPVTITANSTVEVNFTLGLRPVQVGVVKGTVTNSADKTPIAGAWVRAIVGPQPMPMPAEGMTRMESGAAWGEHGATILPDEYLMAVRTDDQGHYTLKVPPMVTALAVYAEGFAPAQVPVGVMAGTETTADVALAPLANTDVTLTGTVTQPTAAGTRTPVADATVYAQPMNLDGGPIMMGDATAAVVYTARTDDQGAYVLPLRPGAYILHAEKDGLRSERVLHTVFADDTQDFTLGNMGPNAQ